jgi:biotin carboxylase
MQPSVLLVYGKGGSALEFMLPRLVVRGIVDVLVIGEPQPWQRAMLERLCRTVIEADPTAPLTDEIVRAAGALASDAVLTFSEFCVVATADACRRLRLPGPGEGARLSRNKWLMRQAWEKAGVPNPAFRAADSLADLVRAHTDIGGPVIVKSVVGAGSIGQVVLDAGADPEPAWRQLVAAIETAKNTGMYEHGQVDGPRFVVEEIIRSSADGWYDEPGFGDYLSVEGLVVSGEYHPICITARLPTIPTFVELSNHAPCVLSQELQHRIIKVCRQAVDALGLDTCATHTEVKLMSDGSVRLLESAARAGGAMITRELVEVFGVDLIDLQVRAALGQRPDLPVEPLTQADATCAAASLSVIAADSRGRPWDNTPLFVPDLVDWAGLVSPDTTVEVVKGQSAASGTPMPSYQPTTGVLGYGGLLFVRATDPLTLRDDCYRVLDGLEVAMTTASMAHIG